MVRLLFIACSTLALSSCVLVREPYPTWTVVDVAYAHLPSAVREAFLRDFSDARVTRIEQSTFTSQLSGSPRKFRIFYGRPGAEGYRVIYDEYGKREVSNFDFWFSDNHRPPAAGSAPR